MKCIKGNQNSFMIRILFALLFLLPACSRLEVRKPVTDLRQELTISSGGQQRSFILRLPDDYNEKKGFHPLIIGMHGFGGSGSQFERNYFLAEKALPKGYILVFPDGNRIDNSILRYWNVGVSLGEGASLNDDVQFISDLIDYVSAEFNVDSKRVYATGMSNGAIMSYKLASELSNKITAIAPVAGTKLNSVKSPTRQVPILHIHSEKDDLIPFEGGVGFGGVNFPPVTSGLSFWASQNNCDANYTDQDMGMYMQREWKNCTESAVILYLTKDGGHSWPGGEKPRDTGSEVSTAVNANDLMLEFFERFSL